MATPPRPFRQVDVFGTGPFSGNPLAVVHDAQGLGDEEMARISTWTNLSECTFLLPPTQPGADYRVRIFAAATELPFAGHPTLGTARAWLDAGGVPAVPGRIVQECGVGLVTVREVGDGGEVGGADELAFEAPALRRSGPLSDAELDDVLAVLGLGAEDVVEARWIDNGPGWIGVLLPDVEAVLAVRPDASRRPGAWSIGVVGLYREDGAAAEAESGPRVEVRGFFSDGSGPMLEDPVTGSLNASVAQWLLGSGRVEAPYVAAQGRAVGRDGRVMITTGEAGAVWVGGAAVVAIRGEITTA
ncbi:PhzF family phenazine biosynthesis protein [Serinibacter arcticus]|uniref:Phenazine biosynthesis protein PhzF like n=1 Tax=Serinibacter arcticus TaxID=1655435 RepID=A0A4Z1DWK9_9MICO|nr:PhzF family phenazine biosynthesis protein [Serinibacter arcticus]TGO03926.1 Phenazine biosynthesis protein PhzF like [Serinibacter arcticus]